MKTGIEQLQESNKVKKVKPKLNTLDKYLLFCFTVILIYTVVGIVFQWVTSIELSTSLTLGVYGFFGGEITLLAMIKRLKLKRGD
jgi:hypothetical protein